jgi:hypothetical protein
LGLSSGIYLEDEVPKGGFWGDGLFLSDKKES